MKRTVKSIKELNSVASLFLSEIKNNEKKATIVLLIGDLGSGKTTFVQQIGILLTISEKINSPTFVISKKYHIKNNKKWKKLIHIDAYRLSSYDDIKNIGLSEELKDKGNLIFIEWGDLIEKFLKEKDIQKIFFEYLDLTTRSISFQ